MRVRTQPGLHALTLTSPFVVRARLRLSAFSAAFVIE